MCLSTAYRNTRSPETLIMKNVMSLECRDGCVILTDLMEHTCAVEGELALANLVEGIVIIRQKENV